MLTKTKIALSSVLVLGLASAAVAQQAPTDPRANASVYTQPYADFDGSDPDAVARPGLNGRSGNVVRERDDFTGFSPRTRGDRYSDTPGNQ
jgi:hypothetical protein